MDNLALPTVWRRFSCRELRTATLVFNKSPFLLNGISKALLWMCVICARSETSDRDKHLIRAALEGLVTGSTAMFGSLWNALPTFMLPTYLIKNGNHIQRSIQRESLKTRWDVIQDKSDVVLTEFVEKMLGDVKKQRYMTFLEVHATLAAILTSTDSHTLTSVMHDVRFFGKEWHIKTNGALMISVDAWCLLKLTMITVQLIKYRLVGRYIVLLRIV